MIFMTTSVKKLIRITPLDFINGESSDNFQGRISRNHFSLRVGYQNRFRDRFKDDSGLSQLLSLAYLFINIASNTNDLTLAFFICYDSRKQIDTMIVVSVLV